MMNDDLFFEKELLKSYEHQLNALKKSIKWEKIYIGLCIFNTFTFLVNTINNFDNKLLSIIYFSTTFLWIIMAYFSIKKIKLKKIALSECKKLYDRQLQIVDYPKYIKEQRIKKLNKIKKSLFN